MNIGLMGCEFVSPNKGCEALTYSIVSIISEWAKIHDNITIFNFSGTELGYIKNEFPNIKFVNIFPRLKDLKFNYIKSLKKCDVILDITMGDGFSDIYSKSYYDNLILHKKIAEFLCENYVLLPQTYGPFHHSTSNKKAVKIFKRAKKIYCRDRLSKKLLNSLDISENVDLTTDLAFILPYNKKQYKFKNINKIGINISGLLYNGGFESDNQFDLTIDYKNLVFDVIEKLIKDNKYEIHIIPHVIDLSNDSHDDDYKVCQAIVKKYPQCILAPAFKTPIEAKSYISNMNVFIGSRMHSTIAAISSGVITIPISYSRKFEGLFEDIDYDLVISGKNLNTDEAFNLIFKYLDECDKISEKVKKAKLAIEDKKDYFVSDIKEFLENTIR